MTTHSNKKLKDLDIEPWEKNEKIICFERNLKCMRVKITDLNLYTKRKVRIISNDPVSLCKRPIRFSILNFCSTTIKIIRVESLIAIRNILYPEQM